MRGFFRVKCVTRESIERDEGSLNVQCAGRDEGCLSVQCVDRDEGSLSMTYGNINNKVTS
jgi:hypothetical protein